MRKTVPQTNAARLFPSAASIWRHLDRMYERSVRTYRQDLTACRRRMSRPAVHRLRVSIRRLLACLDLMGAVQNGHPAVRGTLQRQLKVLGDLRDTQNQLRRIKAEPRFAAALQPLRRHLRMRRQRRLGAVRRALATDRVTRRLRRWRLGTVRKNSRPVARLHRLIDRKLRQAFDPLAAFSPSRPPDSAARHHTRMISRQYRYLVEALQPGWYDEKTGGPLCSLQAYQDVIGKSHDCELLLRRLDRLIADERLRVASARRFRAVLRAEKNRHLKACSRLDRQVFHEALLARQHLNQKLPPC
jgi:CHAD domain-containing protein